VILWLFSKKYRKTQQQISPSINVLLFKFISAVKSTMVEIYNRRVRPKRKIRIYTIRFSVSDGFRISEKVSDSESITLRMKTGCSKLLGMLVHSHGVCARIRFVWHPVVCQMDSLYCCISFIEIYCSGLSSESNFHCYQSAKLTADCQL